MRTILVTLIMILPAFAVPSASAASHLMTDPAGDSQYLVIASGTTLPGLPSQGSTGYAKASDITFLDVAETTDDLGITVGFTDLNGDPTAVVADTDMKWGDREYQLEQIYSKQAGNNGAFAFLQVREGSDWQFVAQFPAPTVDLGASTMTTSVPKVYIMDTAKHAPGRGDSVLFESVVTYTNVGIFPQQADAAVADQMPDAGGKGASYTLQYGDFSQGHLIMSTPDRVRVSNGGATTIVYQVTLRNNADAVDEFALKVDDLPLKWNATFQTPVKVPPKEERTVSVLVSLPFEHVHGGFSAFNLTAQSSADPGSNGRMRLGVLHTPIPQPAGHHDTLFLHTRDPRSGVQAQVFSVPFPYGYGWMNTEEDHTNDSKFMTSFGDGDGHLDWYVPLNPNLQMGLDFDLSRTGTLEATIEGHRDGASDVTAALYYYQGDQTNGKQILLAQSDKQNVQLSQSAATPVKLTLTPTADADYIPYQQKSGMYLKLSATGANLADQLFNSPLRAELDSAGFKMQLPLNEYSDKLTGMSDVAQTISLDAAGPVEKVGRPGTVLTYAFNVKNTGAPGTLILDLAGNDITHASLVPRGEVSLATGESKDVTLGVEVPVGANAGQEFEVLLYVHAKDDPSKMAVARTKTKVAAQGEDANADESGKLLEAQSKAQKTPSLEPIAILGLVAIAAIAVRRRR